MKFHIPKIHLIPLNEIGDRFVPPDKITEVLYKYPQIFCRLKIGEEEFDLALDIAVKSKDDSTKEAFYKVTADFKLTDADDFDLTGSNNALKVAGAIFHTIIKLLKDAKPSFYPFKDYEPFIATIEIMAETREEKDTNGKNARLMLYDNYIKTIMRKVGSGVKSSRNYMEHGKTVFWMDIDPIKISSLNL